jgi:Carboxypeptidase regulatory-like domain
MTRFWQTWSSEESGTTQKLSQITQSTRNDDEVSRKISNQELFAHFAAAWLLSCVSILMMRMKKVVLCSVLFAGLPMPVVAGRDSPATVRGFVYTDPGKPLAGVEIQISSAALQEFHETSTDESGHYRMDDLPPGRYTMWAEMSERGCLVIASVILRPESLVYQDFHFAKGKRYPTCASLGRRTTRQPRHPEKKS